MSTTKTSIFGITHFLIIIIHGWGTMRISLMVFQRMLFNHHPDLTIKRTDKKPLVKDLLGTFILETRARFNNGKARLDNIETHMNNMGATIKSL